MGFDSLLFLWVSAKICWPYHLGTYPQENQDVEACDKVHGETVADVLGTCTWQLLRLHITLSVSLASPYSHILR